MNLQPVFKGAAVQLKEGVRETRPEVKSVMIDLHGCVSEKLIDSQALEECGNGILQALGVKNQAEASSHPSVRRDQKGYAIAQFFEGGSLTLHVDEADNRIFIDLFFRMNCVVEEAARYAKEFFEANKMKLTIFA